MVSNKMFYSKIWVRFLVVAWAVGHVHSSSSDTQEKEDESPAINHKQEAERFMREYDMADAGSTKSNQEYDMVGRMVLEDLMEEFQEDDEDGSLRRKRQLGDTGACGKTGEACCTSGSLYGEGYCFDLVVNACDPATNTCTPCGGTGQPCCQGSGGINLCKSETLTCNTVDNTCTKCGYHGEPCCGHGGCWDFTNRECVTEGFPQPTCQDCGGDGEPCCSQSDRKCNNGHFVCMEDVDGKCHSCGGPNEVCCANKITGSDLPGEGRCDDDYLRICVDDGAGKGICKECGAEGEPCCVGKGGLQMCDRSSDMCNVATDICEACGGRGEQCCPDSFAALVPGKNPTAPSNGASCYDDVSNSCVDDGNGGGICVMCGDVGQPCCYHSSYGDFCDSFFEICNPTTKMCERCGVRGDPCCPGNKCANDSVRACNVATQICEDCGKLGQLACVGVGIVACDSEFMVASPTTALCESCGLDGEPCCDGPQNPCRDSSVRTCVESTNTCQTCGLTGGPCCNGLGGAGACQDPADNCVRDGSSGGVCEKPPPTDQPTAGHSGSPSNKPSGTPSGTRSESPSRTPTAGQDTTPQVVTQVAPQQLVQVDQTVLSLSCPGVGQVITVDAPSTLSLSRSSAGQLCTIIVMDGTAQVPVARSYDGGDWEQYSGKYSDTAISCDTTKCSFQLVELSRDDGYYALSSTPGYTVPPQDVVARFFESTTFGMPMTAISDMADKYIESGGDNVLVSWVAAQMNTTQNPITYHREFYRKRANAIFLGSTSMGKVTHPCASGSSYRRYAFVSQDSNRFIRIKTGPGTTRQLSINGEFVTLVFGNVATSAGTVFSDGTFEICDRTQHWIGGKVRFRHPTLGCQFVTFAGVYGNPPIQLNETDTSIKLVTLDGKAAPIDQSLYRGSSVQMIQVTESSLAGQVCSNLTYGPGAVPTVFGKFNSSFFIHSSRFKLVENTMDSPLPDGGNSIGNAASGGLSLSKIDPRCSNPVRTFHNEDSCTMKRTETVCSTTGTSAGNLVCGSFNEVANDLTLGGTQSSGPSKGGVGAFDIRASYNISTNLVWENQKKQIWTTIVLNAQDQLRQRMAWALSQIIVITLMGVGRDDTEDHLFFYDIFVRHAFGNYRDILREVSYSPMMGVFLSYKQSKSTAFHLSEGDSHRNPDENYAREVMQLFSVGLYMLNDDGTQIKDTDGEPVLTYTNEEIMAYSRAWTGFDVQPRRGNIENPGYDDNLVDFMQVVAEWRDNLPKLGLQKKYIGEGYPLCADLPVRHYLKEGARYRLLGTTSYPELQEEQEDVHWATDPTAPKFTADPQGPLFAALCNSPGANLGCDYKATVTLSSDLACSPNTMGCKVDTIRTVQVEPNVFYEYIRPPCINLAFYKNPKMIKIRETYKKNYMCADPRTEDASSICCSSSQKGYLKMNYFAERVRFSTVEKRCAAETGLGVCANNTIVLGCSGTLACHTNPYYWTNQQCNLKVKINDEDYQAAIVHDVPTENAVGGAPALNVAVNTKTFFGVKWNDLQALESLLAVCGTQTSSCSVTPDGYCLCDVSVSDEIVFHDVPTKDEVLSLPFGAFKPNADSGVYYSSSDVWVFGSSPYSTETVFGAYDQAGKMQYRKNMQSTVSLPSTTLSFPNAVHMISLAVPNKRDALYETEATLDHYFHHPNVAPFLAVRLAQRFVTSNPSPRYIASITNAFRTGSVKFGSQSFGSGVYGDLAATAAAVLLDPEARNTVLEADKFHGKFQEPLTKLISTMRSLLFSPNSTSPFVWFKDLSETIGQMVFDAPNVFSFFQPDFAPEGIIESSTLVAPETSVYNTPEVINMVNGYQSFTKYGLVDCYESFGYTAEGATISCSTVVPGQYTSTTGRFTFLPHSALGPAGVVDELATVMTSGRLSTSSRSLIEGAYLAEFDKTNSHERAVLRAQQLIFLTPEFHTTGRMVPANQPIPSMPIAQSSGHTYKAVVFLLLDGGCDSFNMIVPHNCPGSTLVEDYNDEREELAFTPLERSKILNVAGQPCDQFALHPELHTIEELYNAGDLAFFFNTGVLHAPTNRSNYNEATESTLFSHRDQRVDIQKGDPFVQKFGTGYLGRLADALSRKGYQPDAISIDEASLVVTGYTLQTESPTVVNKDGVKLFHPRTTAEPELRTEAKLLNGMSDDRSSSIFGKTWAAKFSRALDEVTQLDGMLKNIVISTPPAEALARRFEMITKLMMTRNSRVVDRDVFYATLGGFDTHNDMKVKLADRFQELDSSLDWFQTELKRQGLWENVTIVAVSDFGRTLTPNSGVGSDHGWGGNYWMAGGGVKGGQALCKYPSDISEDSPLNVGRGRFIPECAWESVWQAVSGWMFDGNLSEEDRDYILPNALHTGSVLYDMEDLYD